MKKLFLSILIATGFGAAVWAGVAVGGTAEGCAVVGKSTFCGSGTFKPDKLPKRKMAPISLQTDGSVVTDDGSIPPIVRTVQVDFDDDGDVTTKGIPTCEFKQLINQSTEQAKRKCGDAIVGTGTVDAIIKLEDQDAIPASGPLLIMNGEPKGRGKNKKPTVLFHTLIDYPLPTAYVTEAVIEKSKKGKDYGKRVFIDVPPIAGGQGTLVAFNAKIKKRIKVKSKSKKKGKRGKRSRRRSKVERRKYLLARCADKRLIADAELTLENGDKLGIGFVAPCKQKKEKGKRKRGNRKNGKANNRRGNRGGKHKRR